MLMRISFSPVNRKINLLGKLCFKVYTTICNMLIIERWTLERKQPESIEMSRFFKVHRLVTS